VTVLLSLVIGTENREILVLNTAGSATVLRVQLPSIPAFIAVTGSFDVEYRIVVACRNNNVYTIKVRRPRRLHNPSLSPWRRPVVCCSLVVF
jgi:hypothetical protein